MQKSNIISAAPFQCTYVFPSGVYSESHNQAYSGQFLSFLLLLIESLERICFPAIMNVITCHTPSIKKKILCSEQCKGLSTMQTHSEANSHFLLSRVECLNSYNEVIPFQLIKPSTQLCIYTEQKQSVPQKCSNTWIYIQLWCSNILALRATLHFCQWPWPWNCKGPWKVHWKGVNGKLKLNFMWSWAFKYNVKTYATGLSTER